MIVDKSLYNPPEPNPGGTAGKAVQETARVELAQAALELRSLLSSNALAREAVAKLITEWEQASEMAVPISPGGAGEFFP